MLKRSDLIAYMPGYKVQCSSSIKITEMSESFGLLVWVIFFRFILIRAFNIKIDTSYNEIISLLFRAVYFNSVAQMLSLC